MMRDSGQEERKIVGYKLRVQYWPIDKVKPYPNNPRNNDEAVEYVANSIREFSFQQPLVVDTDGTIIAGHTRLKAAKRLGMETVPVVVADNLTPAQVNAYRLADNKVAEAATWDMDALAVELQGLEVDFDMTMFDFDAGISIDGFGEDFELPDGETPEFKTVSLHMTAEQYELFEEMQEQVDVSGEDGNMAARQVCEVIRQWQAQRM